MGPGTCFVGSMQHDHTGPLVQNVEKTGPLKVIENFSLENILLIKKCNSEDKYT